jgi:hypothetical protein
MCHWMAWQRVARAKSSLQRIGVLQSAELSFPTVTSVVWTVSLYATECQYSVSAICRSDQSNLNTLTPGWLTIRTGQKSKWDTSISFLQIIWCPQRHGCRWVSLGIWLRKEGTGVLGRDCSHVLAVLSSECQYKLSSKP